MKCGTESPKAATGTAAKQRPLPPVPPNNSDVSSVYYCTDGYRHCEGVEFSDVNDKNINRNGASV